MTASVTRGRLASHGVAANAEPCMSSRSRLSGSPLTRRPTCFHVRRSGLEDRYLGPCGTIPDHSPMRLALLQSSFDSVTARAFRLERLPTGGLCPHRDITRARPLCAGVPKSPLCSVPRRSQPHDGLLRARARELVSSHSRVQDASRSGVWPLCTATLSHREELPPCR